MARGSEEDDSLVGLELGHYRIREKIGEGGMGAVYRARDCHLERDVAIKVLPPGLLVDEAARKRFHKEALALSSLNHPNIATIHDFDTQQGVDFLVMEYIPGRTLSEKLAEGPLPEQDTLHWGTQLARGLAAAHERAVVHCDLKPDNLRLTEDGWLKILDFGLARLVRPTGPDLTTANFSETQVVGGTLPYMAPEQLRGGEVDQRTDVYAAGAVLYEMATGRRMFPHLGGPSLIDAILHDAPAPPGKLNLAVSAALEVVITKALEKDPKRRYASAHDLLHDLEQVGAGGSSRAMVTTRSWLRLGPRGRGATALGIAFLCVLLLALWGHRGTPALAFAARDFVLIADFENQTGDPVFDRSLNAALATTLEQSSYANVYSRTRVKETLKRMERPNVERIDETVAREIAEREGIKAVVVPSIQGIGESYRLAARIRAVPSGRDVSTEIVRVKGKDKVLDGVDELAAGVRKDLGESLQKISETTKPLVSVTTQSLEALKQYSIAVEKHRGAEVEEAKTYYENALRIDPSFTAARASLGMLHLDQAAMGIAHFDAELGKRLLSEAVQHVANLTDKEKYGILAFHALWVERDPEKAVQYQKALLALYPGYPAAYTNLAWVYNRMGRYQEAVTANQEAIKIDPHFSLAYVNLAAVYLYQLGDTRAALEACRHVEQFDARNAWAQDCIGWSYLGQEDWAHAQAAFEKAVTFNPRNTLYRFRLAHTHRLQGHYREALQALEPILTIDPSETSAWYDSGVVYEAMGERKEAREHFQRFRKELEAQWQKTPKDADAAFALAAVLFRLGENERAWAVTRRGVALAPAKHFEYACVLGLTPRKREAIAQIGLAVKGGYRNYIWIGAHPDLQALHDDAQFKGLLAGLIKK
jgi:eukaryotic-like serine/threonine-protein kinase